jgi:5-methylcytosine-specific restriction endonuclease McrA
MMYMKLNKVFGQTVTQITKLRAKQSISKSLRREVWLKYMGRKFTGKCFVDWCTNKLCCLDSWHVGHVIPESRFGKLTLDNLRPVCTQCNLSMGTKVMTDFSKMSSSISEKDI